MEEKHGILIFPQEVGLYWEDLIARSGLNLVGIHPGGGVGAANDLERLLGFVKTPAFRHFKQRMAELKVDLEFECHAMSWLGGRVLIAEINAKTGKPAAESINQEFGPGVCSFVQTDVGDERSVTNLARQATKTFGKVDVVFNNATIAPIGAVKDKPIAEWDASYRVNLRGPVLLAQAFLPGMLQRKTGVFVCISSVGGIYMGVYEIMKTAQVELAKTLDGELEDSGVIAFTIGPGIVPTATAQAGVALIAPLYGKTVEEFFAMYKDLQALGGSRRGRVCRGSGPGAAVQRGGDHRQAGSECGRDRATRRRDATEGGCPDRRKAPAGPGAVPGSAAHTGQRNRRVEAAQPVRAPVDAALFQAACRAIRRRCVGGT